MKQHCGVCVCVCVYVNQYFRSVATAESKIFFFFSEILLTLTIVCSYSMSGKHLHLFH